MSRWSCRAAVLVGMAVLAVPGRAHADSAEPTDFRTEVVAITPATGAIEVTIEGGDSFVRIRVQRSTEVIVLGYDDEPYLLIDGDGTVFENRRSYATYANTTRSGTADIPTTVDNTADPDWAAVGAGGTWAWHDHRAHWMGAEPPLGMRPGDSLPRQVIPLVVDGRRVEVEIVSTLVARPSWLPTLFGSLAGAALTASSIRWRRAVWAAALWSIVGLTVGLVQYRSLPAETAPRPIWWLPPAVSVVCVALAAWSPRSWRRSAPLFGEGLLVLAAAQLALWGFVRRLVFVRPVLPTDAPYWIDRALTAAVCSGACVLIGAIGAVIGRAVVQPARAASIARSRSS